MSPDATASDQFDEIRANTILCCNWATASRVIANHRNVFVGQLRAAMGFALGVPSASSPLFILSIINVRSDHKVIGVDATRNIAGMPHHHSIRNRFAIGAFPCPDMRGSLLSEKSQHSIWKIFRFLCAPPKNTPRRIWRRIKGQSFHKSHLVMNANTTIFGHSFNRSGLAVASQSRVGVISAARLAMVA